MKLYLSPGACSLADHIALHEAGLPFERETVDLRAHRTEAGEDFYQVNPKGYVPALRLDSGEVLTENIAILDWITHQAETLKPRGAAGHTQHLEALAFISTEIHKGFKPFFASASDDDKAKAAAAIGKRFDYLDQTMAGDYLFGSAVSAADCYLFVMLSWADKFGVAVPARLKAFQERMMARPAVDTALREEGLL